MYGNEYNLIIYIISSWQTLRIFLYWFLQKKENFKKIINSRVYKNGSLLLFIVGLFDWELDFYCLKCIYFKLCEKNFLKKKL